jgi:DNA-binding FadR family transcriptional regulator
MSTAGKAATGYRLPRLARTPEGLHKTVVRDLSGRILRGEFPPGTALPTEALLCARLEVSRTSLREAIRVLAAKGLVESRPRVGTRVLPREAWNRLDPELLQWGAELAPDAAFVAGLIEARQIIEPAAAELAARRATARDVARIEAAFETMAASLPHDIPAYCEADLRFHAGILQASGNPVLAQLINVIGGALLSGFRFTTERSRSYARTLQVHADVLEAIRMRDAAVARLRMEELIGVAAIDLARAGGPAVPSAEAHP